MPHSKHAKRGIFVVYYTGHLKTDRKAGTAEGGRNARTTRQGKTGKNT